jgi:hypothetical protein
MITDAARSDENTEMRMAKSNRSRNVINESGGHLSPTAALMSVTMDGDGMREPEYAETSMVSAHKNFDQQRRVLTRRSWWGLGDN